MPNTCTFPTVPSITQIAFLRPLQATVVLIKGTCAKGNITSDRERNNFEPYTNDVSSILYMDNNNDEKVLVMGLLKAESSSYFIVNLNQNECLFVCVGQSKAMNDFSH